MDRNAYLLHQVHPLKVGADVAADVVSVRLMWQRRPIAALLVAHALAAAGSTVVLRRDLSWLAATRRGRYVASHMPPTAQVLRYAGQCLAWRAAYGRRPAGIALGHLLVVAGWCHGLVPASRYFPAR
jgi:hypothetical protein